MSRRAPLLLLLSPLLLPATLDAGAAPRTLTLATWNMEWLLAPQTLANLRQRCRAPQRPRSLPCDAADEHARDSADFARLARYAARLDADVVALQEVEGERPARDVFRGYDFCFTSRTDLQNVGFAIRRGIAHRCGTDLRELSLRDRVRRGAELILLPGSAQEIRLLAVHLKSGCARQDLGTPTADCTTLRRQVPALEAWIDAQAGAGRRFVVLGDFNRDLQHESGATPGVWAELDDGEPPALRLRNAAQGERFTNCVIGQTYSGYIDYILLGGALADAVVPGSFRHAGYEPADARRYRLPDHCPVAVRVRLP